MQRARATERRAHEMKSLEAERGGDLGDLFSEAVEVGDIVGLRAPSGILDDDHAEPFGQRVERVRHHRPAGAGRYSTAGPSPADEVAHA